MNTITINAWIQLDCVSEDLYKEIQEVLEKANKELQNRGDSVNYMQILSQFDIHEIEDNIHEE